MELLSHTNLDDMPPILVSQVCRHGRMCGRMCG